MIILNILYNYLLSYITASLSNCRYMKGRLTLEKINAAINDMATYAEANAQIIAAPKKKVLLILLILVGTCNMSNMAITMSLVI